MVAHATPISDALRRFTSPAVLLRVEGMLGLAAALALYSAQGYSWLALIVLIAAPDLAILVYGLNEHAGAMAYNIVHTYALPLALCVLAVFAGWDVGLQLALIWLAHISADRMIGYGLKYPGHFKHTHLGRV